MKASEACPFITISYEESFRKTYEKCYEYIFVVLPRFSIIDTKYDVKSLWNDDVVSTEPILIKWREIKEMASFGRIAEINKALLFGQIDVSDAYRRLNNKLIDFVVKNNISLPAESLGEGALDPFFLSQLISSLFSKGSGEIVLSAHGKYDYYHAGTKIGPADVRLVDGKFYPEVLFSPELDFMCRSSSDYYCCLMASNDFELMSSVINECGVEGFLARDDGMDWDVDDKYIIS